MIWWVILLGTIIFVIYKVRSIYIGKIKLILNEFRNRNKEFNILAEATFEVKTNGRKINKWDDDHKIDFVINYHANELIKQLQIYNNLKIWWIEKMPHIVSEMKNMIDYEVSQMVIIGGLFRNRAEKELGVLIAKYNPDNTKFRLCTYTFYQQGELHYSPTLKQMTTDASSFKNITFSKEISPDEMFNRIQFLAKYNFTITHYQYNCKNQRSLMTAQIREEIIRRDESVCQSCGKICKHDEIEIDHIQPISKGGKTVMSNLQVLCIKCNRSKSNKWLESLLGPDDNDEKIDDGNLYENCGAVNVDIKDGIRGYTIVYLDDNSIMKYYVNDNNIIRLENLGYEKLDPGCEVAKNLLKSKTGDIFSVNEYEYLIEKIEYYEE